MIRFSAAGTSWRLVQLLFFNNGYHTAHHLHPALALEPSWRPTIVSTIGPHVPADLESRSLRVWWKTGGGRRSRGPSVTSELTAK